MAVAPGVLLPPTPDVKPKAAAPKSQQKTPEPSNDKTSSFSDMYAKETAKKPAERADGPAKGSRDKPRDAGKDAAEAQPTDAARQPAVAEDGKPLPADGQAKADGEDKVETPVDPLQLLGLGGAVPLLDENTQATLLPPAVPTASSAPASLTEASSDPTLVKLNGVPAVNMALEQGAQDAAQTAKGGPAKSADPRQANLGDALAGLTSDSLTKAVDGKALEAQLQQTAEPAVASAASESLLESKAEPRGEPFAAKLNGLTQAMAQQALTNRPVNGTVPGQPVAMQQNGWSEAVVDRVMWMSSQNLKSAEIQLDPAELGRLDVRIHMTADQTQVTFASPNAGVRDALESQMHRLRDMFSQQGMNQLDVNVSDQSLARGWQGQQQGEGGSARGRGLAGEASGDEETLAGVSEIRSRPGASAARGLVDYYA